MKKIFLPLIFSLLLAFTLINKAFALTIPAKPENYVNDYAGLLSSNTIQQLDSQLQQYETHTSNQIVVAIFPSLEQENLEDFAVRLEQQWKIGRKGRDNGVILLIFAKEHKIRIEVGYGLEGAIPDALAFNIITNQISPYFKQVQYDAGVTKGVIALMQAAQHEYKPIDSSNKQVSVGLVWLVIFVIIFGLIIIFGSHNGGGSGGFGGSNSGGGGGFSGGGGSSGGGGASGSW